MKWILRLTVVCVQRLILSHLFWLSAFLQQLLMRNTNTGRLSDKHRTLLFNGITTKVEHVVLSQDFANSCVKRFHKDSKVKTFVELQPLDTVSEAIKYWICMQWVIFFPRCSYMNLPAFGFSAPRLTAPRAHLCQSLILESLLPEKNEKQNLKSERGRWSFLTSGSKFGLVAYSWKSLLHRVSWVIQGRERK